MTRLKLDGASYAFCLPDGGWGALMPASINTSEGAIPLPGESVLFLVGARYNGRLLLAGQGHDSGSCWFWDGAVWSVLASTFGVSPCAFGADALYVAVSMTLYIRVDLASLNITSHPVASIGSQGLRYVDGQTPITGDLTYRDGELFEWTRRGDVRVGQGHEGGAIINDRVLDPGDRRFIRFERDGDRLAVAMVDLPGHAAILYWLTVADIAGLPPLVPVQPPVPVPVPPPTPEPVPTMTLPQNIKEIRDRYVSRFQVPQGQGPEDFNPATNGASDSFENKCRDWVRGLAEQVRYETNDPAWGVKNAGGGRPQSKDSLANNGARLINYDLLTGVGTGHPGLVADPQGEDITGQTFMPVQPVNHLDVPTPEPVPTPVPTPTPTPTPTPVPVPFIDEEVVDLLRLILASNQDQEKQIAGLRRDVVKVGATVVAALASGIVKKPAKKVAKKR